MQEAVRRAQAWLEAHETELVEDTRSMLRIASVESDPVPGGPFGAENLEALEFALSLARKWGFSEAKNLDGYCGWAEVGSGDKMVITLGHLDVVPVGPGWKHAPFGAEIDGDYLYARGATDDKGPTMAAFYAIRALKESGFEFPCRLRAFFGSDEESGFMCIEHYAKTEEIPTLGVAPDSGWPLIYAEKGICNLVVSAPLPSGPLRLLRAEGGSRPNIVIDAVTARAQVSPEARAEVEEKLADAWDRNVTFRWEGDDLLIETVGKAAHGSTPFSGDSAATRLFRFLAEISPVAGRGDYERLLESTHPSGVGLGIHGRDTESGDLTNNLGILRTENGRLVMTFNVRRPVTFAMGQVKASLLATLPEGWALDSDSESAPLFFPLDHVLTRAIVEAYRAETGDLTEPGVMGGGTYARALPNCVSIGTGWAGDGEAHQTDERIKVAHLLRMAKIYAHIFVRLCHAV